MKIPNDEMGDLIEYVNEEEEGGGESSPHKNMTLSRIMQSRVEEVDKVERFLGSGKKVEVPVVVEHYYENLLALALNAYLKSEKWKVVRVLGLYKDSKPDYNEINIGPGKRMNVLSHGRLLLKRGESRLSVRIKFTRHGERAWIAVEGPDALKKEVKQFAADIDKTVKKLQLYRGQNLKYDDDLEFLEPAVKRWDDLSLAPELKEELMANTVGFLKRSREFARYGIPSKRGLILAGKPGTGKTRLMAEFHLVGDHPALARQMAGKTGVETSLYGVLVDERHIILGNGLTSLLTLPAEKPPAEGPRWCNRMNLLESSEWTGFHLLGAWATIFNGENSVFLGHRGFLPAFPVEPELLVNLALANGLRSKWVSSRLGKGL